MQKIVPCLWFDNNAEEAMNFYTSVFKNSKIINRSYYLEGSPGPAGSLMVASFIIEDQEYMVLNGGPYYKMTPGISFYVKCENQEEVDYYWNKLLDGGTPMQCGWITDQFGVSWQIVPTILGEMLNDTDKEKAKRVMDAMLKMIKIEIPLLQKAYNKE